MTCAAADELLLQAACCNTQGKKAVAALESRLGDYTVRSWNIEQLAGRQDSRSH